METARNEIKKAVIKKDRLNVVYNERFTEANITNNVTKNCDNIVHGDLKDTFNRMKLHLIVLCEQPESININNNSFNSPGFVETIPNYYITGYSNDSNDGIPGITISGVKMLKSGRIVDLKIFVSLSDEEYPFLNDLKADAAACDEEVIQYLFHDKWGYKQEQLDFECDEPIEVAIENVSIKPKRKRNSKRTVSEDIEAELLEAV